MAFSLITHSVTGSANSYNITTVPLDTTGARLIVITTGVFSAYAPIPTDSMGNTYTGLAIATSVLGGFSRLWYCLNAVVGPGHIFYLPGYSVCYPSMAVSAWASTGAVSFDQQNGAQAGGGSSTTAQPGTITPSVASELLVTGVVANGGLPSAINSSFTLLDALDHVNLFSLGLGLAYQIQTTATARNPTWTGTDLQATTIASFSEAGSPPTPPTPPVTALPPGLALDPITGVISGTPTLAGTYTYTVQVTDANGQVATVTCTIVITEAGGTRNTLRWQIDAPSRPGRWFAHQYADPVNAHYIVEPSASAPNDQELYLLGPSAGIMESGGATDNGAALNTFVLVPSNDLGDERSQKLYPDAMIQLEGNGILSASPAFDNATSYASATLITAAGPVRQALVNIASLTNLALHRNIGVALAWTGGPNGPRVLAWEPAAYLQPYISRFLVTQFINLSYPGWKSHRRLYPALISTANVIFTIKCQDGRTFVYTIPSTGGQFLVIPMIVDHGVKDLAFAYQLDGQGTDFALFPDAFTIESKGWPDPEFLDLAIYKT